MRAILSLVAVLLVAGSGFAQAERYELGQRLKAFEKQWDKTTDEKLKKKAAEGLPKLTGLFFTGQFGEAGRMLDEARWILEGKQPTDDEKWAHSLYAVPDTRFFEPGVGEWSVEIKSFYTAKGEKPKGLAVTIEVPGYAENASGTLDTLPVKLTLKKLGVGDVYIRGDAPLTVGVRICERSVTAKTIGVSVGTDFAEGFGAGQGLLAKAKKSLAADSLEWGTAVDRIGAITELSKGAVQETDIPAGQLLRELGEIVALGEKSKPYFTHDRPGDFWLSVPTRKTRTPARLFVPEGLNPKKPVPLVIALHGAGGSENMFFEGYGDGQILKLCQKRGWMLVSPRSGLSLVGGGPPVAEIIDELAKRYPIDPKAIFIVGHSMGAMQAIDAVQKYPGKFAGLAAFGGDGRVRKPELFAELPTFIGVGDKDFALVQVRKLKKTLEDAKAKALTYKEYEGLEHLLIVREALPDAFALFDTIVKK